jgi:ABC-2 type transport system permease protein
MVVVRPPGRPSVIAVELTKQARRARGWATMGIMAVVSLVVVGIVGSTNATLPERVGNWTSVVTDTSAFTFPLITLNSMVLFMLPLAAAVFAGESVAGEASWGSLRYVLAKPVARWRVLGAKALLAACFTVTTVAVVVLVTVVAGAIAYGWAPLTVVDLRHTTALHIASATFTPLVAAGRIVVATGFVALTLASTFSFAFFLSTACSAPFAAVAGGMGLVLVSRALDNIPGLGVLSPWLPATDAGTTAWTGLFTTPFQGAGIVHEALVQLVYTLVFLTAAWVWFTRRDVLR